MARKSTDKASSDIDVTTLVHNLKQMGLVSVDEDGTLKGELHRLHTTEEMREGIRDFISYEMQTNDNPELLSALTGAIDNCTVATREINRKCAGMVQDVQSSQMVSDQLDLLRSQLATEKAAVKRYQAEMEALKAIEADPERAAAAALRAEIAQLNLQLDRLVAYVQSIYALFSGADDGTTTATN